MSRTFKDMNGGVRARRRRAILGRERARQNAQRVRTPLSSGFTRRGRRKQERRLTDRSQEEDAI
jgi:hypothetical protein